MGVRASPLDYTYRFPTSTALCSHSFCCLNMITTQHLLWNGAHDANFVALEPYIPDVAVKRKYQPEGPSNDVREPCKAPCFRTLKKWCRRNITFRAALQHSSDRAIK